MTRDPQTIAPDLPIAEAVRIMVTKRVGGLPDVLHVHLDALDGRGCRNPRGVSGAPVTGAYCGAAPGG